MVLSQESKRLLDIFLKNSYGMSHPLDIKRFANFVQQTLEDNSLFLVEYNETYDYIKNNSNFSDDDIKHLIDLYYKIFYLLYHIKNKSFSEIHINFIKDGLGLD